MENTLKNNIDSRMDCLSLDVPELKAYQRFNSSRSR